MGVGCTVAVNSLIAIDDIIQIPWMHKFPMVVHI